MTRLPLLVALLALTACSDDSSNKDDVSSDSGSTDDTGGADDTGEGGTSTSPLSASFFDAAPTLLSATTVDCDMEDGSVGRCWELRFGANPLDNGPYCPETIDDVGGLGVYDGPTDPGFQVLKRPLWEAMEADGYDIVDDDGNINIMHITGEGGGPPPLPEGDPSRPACLEAVEDDDLTLRFLIPVTPALMDTPDTIDEVENVGLALDGVPINGTPPSVVERDGNIPALDPCGGHMDPFGYYHWHLIAPGANTVLDAYSISELRCTNVAQDDDALVGFARDGFPIYGSMDADGAPADLDDCNGHTGATPDFPGGVYHYHASADTAPSVPGCVVGLSAVEGFTYE